MARQSIQEPRQPVCRLRSTTEGCGRVAVRGAGSRSRVVAVLVAFQRMVAMRLRSQWRPAMSNTEVHLGKWLFSLFWSDRL